MLVPHVPKTLKFFFKYFVKQYCLSLLFWLTLYLLCSLFQILICLRNAWNRKNVYKKHKSYSQDVRTVENSNYVFVARKGYV